MRRPAALAAALLARVSPAAMLLSGMLAATGCTGGGDKAGERTGAPVGHAQAQLVAERDAAVPGDTLALGVSFAIEPGWHLYGNAANDTGYPIQVKPELPRGYQALDLIWPAPERHVSPGDILDHVYEERVTLILPVAVPTEARTGDRVTLRARLYWLVCKDVCLPESASVSLALPVRAHAEADPAAAALFAESRSRVPKPISAEARARWEGTRVVLEVPGADALAFFPSPDCARIAHLIRDGAAEGDRLVLSLADSVAAPVKGVLEVTRGDGSLSFHSIGLAPGEAP